MGSKLFRICMILATTTAAEAADAPMPALPTQCEVSREFITAMEYLRDHKDFKIPEGETRKLADQVASGCTGSAKRFIQVTSTLVKSGLTAKNAVEGGLKFAPKTDAQTETFLLVFRTAFLKEHLDLDMRSSMRLALGLSDEFEGDTLKVRQDFLRLVRFCVEAPNLDLPKPDCGAFAARIARLGEPFQKGVAEPFIATFEFLRSERGPSLITSDALSKAEEIVRAGPASQDNFVNAYRYASAEKGLNLQRNEAIGFATQMALKVAPAAVERQRAIASTKAMPEGAAKSPPVSKKK